MGEEEERKLAKLILFNIIGIIGFNDVSITSHLGGYLSHESTQYTHEVLENKGERLIII